MLNLEKLKELAEKATPGPWKIAGERYSPTGKSSLAIATNHEHGDWENIWTHHYCKPDAEFIAAFNPETALKLITRIEKLDCDNTPAYIISGELQDALDALGDAMHEP